MTRIRSCLPILFATLGALAASASCGDAIEESKVSPCGEALKCGEGCAGDSDCKPGLYCGAEKTCTADCTPGGNECEAGKTCTPFGRCQGTIIGPDGGGTGGSNDGSSGEGCIDFNLKLEKTIPTVVLLIDQSGSMDAAFGTGSGNRWTVLKDALLNPTTGLISRLEDDVRFGLALYTSRDDNGDGTVEGACPRLTEVAISLANFQAIQQVYGPANYDSETPTGDSIQAVTAQLIPYDAPGPKVIVLATDGEPDTCEQPNPQNGQQEAIQAAQDAFQADIQTYIITVGDDVSASHQQDMANAGVGLPVGGSQNAPFYNADNQQELADAFNTIINGVRDCKLKLNGQVDPADADKGTVILDGETLVLDAPDGWQLNNSTEIELLGAACDKIKTGEHDVDVSFPCGVVTPIPQ